MGGLRARDIAAPGVGVAAEGAEPADALRELQALRAILRPPGRAQSTHSGPPGRLCGGVGCGCDSRNRWRVP